MKSIRIRHGGPERPHDNFSNRRDTENAIDRVTVSSDPDVLRIAAELQEGGYNRRFRRLIKDDRERDKSQVTLPRVALADPDDFPL